jgi:hypothetical protein
LQLHNPIGFATGDFIELGLAAFLVLLAILWGPYISPFLDWFGARKFRCMMALAILPVGLRLALLPHHPVPTPDIYDEFGHLLVADTLRHFRLANPPHALPQFFETFFVLQRPTYSSIYPIGQGLALAFGWMIFGLPWAGVLASCAALCALCYWMLRGWTSPRWALLGGLLCVFEFGPLNAWTNDYWGGSLAAAGGCLVFGALPRLREKYRVRDAVWLGLGMGINLLVRPYESVFLVLSVILFWLPDWRRAWQRPALIAALVVLPAIGITLLQNERVTGSWMTLPYSVSQYQYGVPASLTFQANATPHNILTREQDLEYKSQRAFRASEVETAGSYFRRLIFRIRYYRFFFYAPLYLALIAFVPAIRSYRYLWVVSTVALFALGTNFFPAFQFHYMAAVVCLFVLMSVAGLEWLSRWDAGAKAANLILWLCLAQFVFAYATGAVQERIPSRRIAVDRQVAQIPGKLLVFVRYWPNHIFQDEWVYNGADIDGSRVVWARDLGEPEDEKLRKYYPGRAVWLLEPDAMPPALTPYKPEPALPPAEPPKKEKTPPPLRFENIP